jgi:hypothetical protein
MNRLLNGYSSDSSVGAMQLNIYMKSFVSLMS